MKVVISYITLSLLGLSSFAQANNSNELALRCTQVGVSGPGGARYLDVTIDKSTTSVSKVQELHADRNVTVTANASCDRRNFVNEGASVECAGTMTPTPAMAQQYGEKPYDFSLVLGENLKGAYVGAFSFDDLATDLKTNKKFTALWVYDCAQH